MNYAGRALPPSGMGIVSAPNAPTSCSCPMFDALAMATCCETDRLLETDQQGRITSLGEVLIRARDPVPCPPPHILMTLRGGERRQHPGAEAVCRC